MASPSQLAASMARISLSAPSRQILPVVPRFLAAPSTLQTRTYAAKGRDKGTAKGTQPKQKKEAKRKKKGYKEYFCGDLRKMHQWTLCDAMRYIRAIEVGQPPSQVKYDLAVRIRTNRNSKPLRSRIVLPHPVKMRSATLVICPEGPIAESARAAGALMAGESSVFEAIRQKEVRFDKVIAHEDSMKALNEARLGPVLRQMMPSAKNKTVTKDVPRLMKEMAAAETYRERFGTVRLPIGQLGYTPTMLSENIKAFVDKLRDDMESMDDGSQNTKTIHEVVLSSTHSMAFSLNGGYQPTEDRFRETDLVGAM